MASNLQNSKSPILPSGWLAIGKIIAAQGLKGEVRIFPDSDFPERFLEPGNRWLLKPGVTEPQPMQLLRGRYLEHKGLYVVQFAEISDRDQAEALRGTQLVVPESDRPPLEEDEFHVLDLIGLPVLDQQTQTLLGKVLSVIPAGNDLLEVELVQSVATEPAPVADETESAPVKTVLIPFVKAIVPVVDLQNRRIEITPPPGLIE